MFNAGANRYLLRHETADEKHYDLLHPGEMSYKHRVQCLESLREIGFTVGCGFMVGSPFQTLENISSDLKFIVSFRRKCAELDRSFHKKIHRSEAFVQARQI